jgi:hypothetical protein
VSRSAYYDWLKKGEGPSEADLDEAYVANAIYDIWKKCQRSSKPAAQRDGVQVIQHPGVHVIPHF